MTLTNNSYTIEHQDNMLFVDIKGPFNEAIVQDYQQEMYNFCQQLQGQPWGSIVTYYGNGVFSPDTEQALIELTKYRVEHGMVANATVIIDSCHADLQQMQLRRIYQPANVMFYVFSDINSAKEWLTGFLAQRRAAM